MLRGKNRGTFRGKNPKLDPRVAGVIVPRVGEGRRCDSDAAAQAGRGCGMSKSHRRPQCLKPGDPVACCAPSYAVAFSELEDARKPLEARYAVRDAGGAASAFDDEGRRAGLAAAFAPIPSTGPGHEAARAVFCSRGGYGLQRIATELVSLWDQPSPPWLVGYSDITILHMAAFRAGVQSLHAPVVKELSSLHREDLATLFARLEGRPVADPEGLRPLIDGHAEGLLTGGNLAVLAGLAGTGALPRFRDAVLMLEEIDEAPYRVDRFLTQLRLAGALDGVAGVVLGDFTGCGTAEDLDAVLRDRLAGLGVPVWRGLAAGHGERKTSLPFGARVRLGDGRLAFLDDPR